MKSVKRVGCVAYTLVLIPPAVISFFPLFNTSTRAIVTPELLANPCADALYKETCSAEAA